MLHKVKSLIEDVPEPFGRALVRVPFAVRFGHSYSHAQRDILRFTQLSTPERRQFIFARVRKVVEHTVANNMFYQWFYGERGFSVDQLRGFDDLRSIPIVTKADLRHWDLDHRSTPVRGRFSINTGGTSGQPLEFYSTRRVFGHEWAHMHSVWKRIGYRQTDLKLTFRGKHIGARAVKYNPIHNEFVVNAYLSLPEVGSELVRLLRKRTVRYLHGYPSRLYEFAGYCLTDAPDLLKLLRGTLRGIMLGSEYPAPMYREVIERAFPVPSVSWYGHSEMSVLAAEGTEKYAYCPMQSYGYAESIATGDGSHRLVGTSYTNLASPFIRYDTGDEITPTIEGGVLRSFRIDSGRTGDFVTDRSRKRISLTALIFGRHHEAFGWAEFIQVQNPAPGCITILIVPSKQGAKLPPMWRNLFDFSGIDMDVKFELRETPVRTPAGKTPLMVVPAYE